MLLVIDIDKDIVNREVFNDNKEISYPFFDNSVIDNYISDYLNDYIESDNDVLVDYDYDKMDGNYYLTFYSYIWGDGFIHSGSDSFVIDIGDSSILKVIDNHYEYDFINGRDSIGREKFIALTFDDGPNYNTNKILNTLDKYNVPATFFVLGSRIKGNEYILKRMSMSKMEIGNHTFNHLLLTKYDEEKVKMEISTTSDLIFEVTGKYPKLLRPSYGSINKTIKKVANMPIIIWDIDTLDWKYHNSKRISNRVISKVRDGDIILMHDIYSATSNALEIIIPTLKDMGYTFVTVSDLFYYKGISLEEGKVYGFAR